MKNFYLFIFTFLIVSQSATGQVVNIPDANFKSYLVGNTAINTNGDTEIQESEANAFSGKIDLFFIPVNSLVGLEAFKNIYNLDCGSTGITDLNISSNTNLGVLDCANNKLTSLDVSKNTKLTFISCESNQITSLDVSKNLELNDLDCGFNKLTTLDLSKNTDLELFSCYDNKIKFLDLSKNLKLTSLSCSSNELSVLDVSNNVALTGFGCFSNQIKNLDVSKNIKLKYLYFYENLITTIDVTKNTQLLDLSCNGNQLTNLDLSKNILLTKLNCQFNKLLGLDIGKNLQLTQLNCSFNSLKGLNLNNNNNIIIKYLNATKNSTLTCIQVDDPTQIPSSWQKDVTATYNTKCAGVSTKDELFSNTMKLYPNPAINNFAISWEGDFQNINIELLNSQGAVVKSQIIENNGSINVENLPKGLYICQIKDGNKPLNVSKVIVE